MPNKLFIKSLLGMVLYLSAAMLNAQTATMIYNPTSKQGVEKQYSSGSSIVTYFTNTTASNIEFTGISGMYTEERARYKFTHAGYTNAKITRLSLVLNLSDVDPSNGAGASLLDIGMMSSDCPQSYGVLNDDATESSLNNCIHSAPTVFFQHAGTNGTSYSAEYLLHDPTVSVDNSAYWNGASTSIYITLNPYTGTLNVNSIQLRVTYLLDPISNNTICCSQTIFSGASATLTGSAPGGGTGTYTYQWQKSTDNATWSNISGATNANYTPTNITSATYYRRTVSSGTVPVSNSSSVLVSLYPALGNNTVTPAVQNLVCGSTYFDPALLTGASPSGGNGSYTYQWESSMDNTTWTTISGATARDYDPPAFSSGYGGTKAYYRRKVTSGTYVSTSASVVVNLSWPDPITNNVIDYGGLTKVVDCSNGTVDLPLINGSTPSGGGTSTYTYQWGYVIDNDHQGYYPNSNTKDFDPPAVTVPTIIYRVVTVNNCNSGITTANDLYIYPAFSNNTISGNQTYTTCIADPAVITGATPATNFTAEYQWEQSTDNVNWTTISGATQSSYDPASVSATTYFRRLFRWDATCSYTPSNVVTITIAPASTVVTVSTPGNVVDVCAGGSITLSASSAQPSTYTWYKNGTLISGATSASYASTTTGSYYAVAANTCGTFTSNTVVITAHVKPTANLGSDLSVCNKQAVPLSPSVTSAAYPLTYAWTADVTGALSCYNCAATTFRIMGIKTAIVTVTVTDPYGCTGTDNMIINVGGANGIGDNVGLCGTYSTAQSLLKAYDYIYTGNQCAGGITVLNPGANVSARAGISVTLSPGFHAKSGSYFNARIGNPCLADNLRVAADETEEAILSSPVLFPNPSDGLINIVLPASYADFEVSFIDAYGQTVLSKSYTGSTASIEATELTSGLYYVIVSSQSTNWKLKHLIVK